MSDHRMDKSLISAYCDGELNAVELEQAEKLLETSDAARAELQSYRQLSALLRESGRPAVQAGLTTSVLQAIRSNEVTTKAAGASSTVSAATRKMHPPKPGKWVRRWTLVATSAACLMMLLWLGMGRRDGKPQVAVEEQPAATQETSVAAAAVSSVTTTVKDKHVVVANANDKTAIAKSDVPPAKPLEANQLPVDFIQDLKNSNVGQLQKFVRDNKDGVTVFHLMVLDIKPGMESLEMILSAQQISAVDGKPVNNRSDVVAVYVEANQDKMEKLVQQIKEDHEKFLALAVQRDAMPNQQVAALAAKKTSDSTQAVLVNAGELKEAGVAPLQSKQIEIALNEKGRRGSQGGRSLANSLPAPGNSKVNESPMLKLLILVEQATPESLRAKPASE